MELELVSVENVGDLPRERVVLRAKAACDLGKYAVFRCRKSNDDDAAALSGHVPAAFWFAETALEPGDLVVLYTKRGVTSKKEKGDSTPSNSYFFYWGQSEPFWSGAYVPALVNTARWFYSKSKVPTPGDI